MLDTARDIFIGKAPDPKRYLEIGVRWGGLIKGENYGKRNETDLYSEKQLRHR